MECHIEYGRLLNEFREGLAHHWYLFRQLTILIVYICYSLEVSPAIPISSREALSQRLILDTETLGNYL